MPLSVGVQNLEQGGEGPQPLRNRFRAKQQVLRVLQAPGTAILLALDARRYPATVTRAFSFLSTV